MQALLDFFPLIAFLMAYKTWGILNATAVLMVATTAHLALRRWQKGKLNSTEWITLIAVLAFGSLTLLFRSETILKWKAPAVNWLLASLFLGSQFFGKKPFTEHMLGSVIQTGEK